MFSQLCGTRHGQVFSSANVTIQMTTELQSSGCRLGTRIARLCKGFGKYFPTRGLARGREWSDVGAAGARCEEEEGGGLWRGTGAEPHNFTPILEQGSQELIW